MTSPGERIPEIAAEDGEQANPDVAFIRAKMAQFGLAASEEIVLMYVSKVTDSQNRPIRLPALLPLDQIDLCPAPLSEMPDEVLEPFLTASQAELLKLPEGSEKRVLAKKIGERMMREFGQRSNQG